MMDDLKKAVNAPERLIDANELMEWLRTKIRECVFLNAHAEAATTEEIIRYVKHMPAVDAIPVEWLENKRENLILTAMVHSTVYGDNSVELCHAVNVVLDMWQKEQEV